MTIPVVSNAQRQSHTELTLYSEGESRLATPPSSKLCQHRGIRQHTKS